MMTDEAIIKALECCSIENCEDCKKDWNYVSQWDCMRHIMRLSLDLINRQKAEIEKLNIELKAMRGSANSYKAEIERLRTQQSELISEYKNIAIDAIKNFAERLKKSYSYHPMLTPAGHKVVPTDDIDSLVIKMVGDEDV